MEGGIAILLILILFVMIGIGVAIFGTSSVLARFKTRGLEREGERPTHTRPTTTAQERTELVDPPGPRQRDHAAPPPRPR